MTATFFRSHSASSKSEKALEPPDLVSRIKLQSASEKKKLPWLKLARFGSLRTNKNSLRSDANVLAITGVEADYDGEIVTFAKACEIARQAAILCVIYTSPSHTEDKPRWRVLCPTSKELPPAERDRLLARLNGPFGGIFSIESWTLSQSYYYGSVNGNPSHQVELLDGTPIDLFARARRHGDRPAGTEDRSQDRPSGARDRYLRCLRKTSRGLDSHYPGWP